ncbi:MAG TPA: DUF1097 domain-containing protein [Steroidobacteraceae bacterium]
MSQLLALSLSIGILGAIWAYLALDLLSSLLLVWAGFIAWGCYFHTGANGNALTKTIVGNAYGAIIGWIALLVINNVHVGLPGAVWPAIVVGVTVFFLVIVASISALSVVPANVYGYAAIVAYALSAGASADSLTSATAANPLIKVIASMILGALFGLASNKLSAVLAKKV